MRVGARPPHGHPPGRPVLGAHVDRRAVSEREPGGAVQGGWSAFYEEGLLFTLIRLAHPVARLVYLTSQPIQDETLEYYLQHLPGVPISHARRRVLVLCVYDATPRPLTAKILERPRLLARMRAWVGPPQRAYLTVYNSTHLERRLAVELGVPLNAVDPELLWLGTKSGSRRVFAEAGVDLPCGANDVYPGAGGDGAVSDRSATPRHPACGGQAQRQLRGRRQRRVRFPPPQRGASRPAARRARRGARDSELTRRTGNPGALLRQARAVGRGGRGVD